uniref:protein-ribulosamine 3-kinase n=1 Tax=Malurus cyaneus samueli TaxID=2593467 RepID=A0A8C5UL49_9PASS
MEEALKRALGTAVLRPTGHSGGGCISQGRSYDTTHSMVLLSCARRMFLGEMESLEAILKTQAVRVPKPIKVVELPGDNAVLLADLHLHNQQLREKIKKEGSIVGKGQGQMEVQFVDRFGFHTVTCCGYLPQVNNWHSDWVSFFARQRIQPQMDLIERSSETGIIYMFCFSPLQLKIPSFFSGIEIVPSLLHGDLWGGNVAEDDSGPVIFDPASFYGHSEYDLAIAGMFGGFDSAFYSAYHSKIPRITGFEKRLKLYQLFHYMNHWNHFGSGGYRRVFFKHYEKPCKTSWCLSQILPVWKTPD